MSDRQKRSASMTTSTPPQGVPYLGHITDSGRWANFRHHADDIFICTPPKCGTTWTQTLGNYSIVNVGTSLPRR